MTVVREISGWGRWPRRICTLETPRDPAAAAAAAARPGAMIARGLGRAYGDAALNPDRTVAADRLNRFESFDPDTGVLIAEAGVSLAEIIETFLPRGFFPAVTPGTKFVTLGGAIAADVHGKNHHAVGSFGDHVLWLDLATAGGVRRCSPDASPDLFNATIGGMGLTGIVLRAAIGLMRVQSGWMRQRTVVAPDLSAAIAVFEGTLHVPYSVAWIDCLATGTARGRSLVYLGDHAGADDLDGAAPFDIPRRAARSMRVDAPSGALNRWSVRAFNAAYFRAGARKPAEALVDWDRYFYPLDAIHGWNRIYGRRGFAQHQCALPLATSQDALAQMLDAIAASGLGSFLAVLKRFGPGAPQRPLSFPIEGYTLALDLPLTGDALTLMGRLDDIVVAAHGRIYLAKDARMTQRTFESGYGPGLGAFAAMTNPSFSSLQSKRLGL
ncbi:MAG: decaprenylphospho-beta-D-ribofuranose 2-oxidase [Paracoccaceae bacterium]|jgi:decaprenylphospho-beta-D-ribofuranose 2-oxidase